VAKLVRIQWPADGEPVLFFVTDGRYLAWSESEDSDLCVHARSALFAEAIAWGRFRSDPVPLGWRVAPE